MNIIAFIVSSLAGALCLILSIWLFFANASNQTLQSELQRKQQEAQNQQQQVQLKNQQMQQQQQIINQGNVLSQQVGPAVLRDLASLTVQNKNEKIRGLLAKYGLNIREDAAAQEGGAAAPAGDAAPGASPAPAPAPRPTAPASGTTAPRPNL